MVNLMPQTARPPWFKGLRTWLLWYYNKVRESAITLIFLEWVKKLDLHLRLHEKCYFWASPMSAASTQIGDYAVLIYLFKLLIWKYIAIHYKQLHWLKMFPHFIFGIQGHLKTFHESRIESWAKQIWMDHGFFGLLRFNSTPGHFGW